MVKAIMHGCGGKMGQTITDLCEKDPSIEIVAGIDPVPGCERPYPVYASLEEFQAAGGTADVLIDFSAAPAVDAMLNWCGENGMPVILCTTGLSEDQLALAKEISAKVPVLHSANMSLGMNLLFKLVQTAAQVLADSDFDIEIVEQHHNQKKDAPSGTALALANAINEALQNEYHYTYDRSQIRAKRDPKEIGISSVRGGSIVGIHDVIFAGQDEVITFNHTAYSKAIFGKGAVQAAKFLADKEPGMYDMSDVIG